LQGLGRFVYRDRRAAAGPPAQGENVKMTRATALVLSIVLSAFNGCATHVQRALDDLESAKAQLHEAEHNMGGHREQAIADIDRAIAQVREGQAFRETH
jgi:hypothetical protein